MSLKELRDKLRQAAGRGTKHPMVYYANTYAEELGTAFEGRESQRQLLIFCWRLFNENRFDACGRTLGKLWQECRTDEDRRAVLILRALCLTDVGAIDAAVQSYHMLLSYVPGYAVALSNLGNLLMRQGKYQAAEEYLQRAVETDASNPQAWNNLGVVRFRQGRYEDAIPCFSNALRLKGNLYQSAATMALCHTALGNDAEGERYYQIAVANGQDAMKLRATMRNIAAGRQDTAMVSAAFRPVLESWKLRTSLDSIVVGLSPDIGHSYVGGASLGLPPLDSEGKPMRQLAAIFCEDFPGVGLPERGLIRIYIAENERFGLDMEHPNVQSGFRVLYDEEYDHLTPGTDPGFSGEFPVGGRYAMSIHSRGKQAMPMGDYRFEDRFEVFLTEMGAGYPGEDDLQIMDRILSPERHRIGGYAWFTQSDPRQDERYRKYDTLLFQLDCMEWGEMHIRIGDEGVMNFFIPAENLKKRDFSDVLYWWDCH